MRFYASSVSFLGPVVSADGISMDPANVHAVRDWLVPDTRTAHLRIFGFTHFYRRFIRNFGQVAAPLTAPHVDQVLFHVVRCGSGDFRSSKGIIYFCTHPDYL